MSDVKMVIKVDNICLPDEMPREYDEMVIEFAEWEANYAINDLSFFIKDNKLRVCIGEICDEPAIEPDELAVIPLSDFEGKFALLGDYL